MGASARPEQDPMLRLQYYRETGQPDLAKQYETYLSETGQLRPTTETPRAERERMVRARDRERKNREEANAPLTRGEQLAASFINALDAGTFGLAGLATDALSPGSFRQNRDARQEVIEKLSGSDRLLSSLAGGLANPVQRFLPAGAPGSGLLAKAGRAAGEGALQGAAQAAGENIGTTRGASAPAVMAALGGAVGGGLLGGAGWLAEGGKTLVRVARAQPLDVQLAHMDDSRKAINNLLYGQAEHEAKRVVSTPEIADVLESQTVRPFARKVAGSPVHAGKTDAENLMTTYRGMSSAQRDALKSISATAEEKFQQQLTNQEIGMAKRAMLDAIEPSAPTFPLAVATNRARKAEMGAFTETRDAVRDILSGKKVPGEKLLVDSPEQLRRTIGKMTKGEAEAALNALYATGREEFRLTSNPLTAFNLVPSTVRGLLLPGRLDPFVNLLEKQAGRTPTAFDRAAGSSQKAAGLLGRVVGANQP